MLGQARRPAVLPGYIRSRPHHSLQAAALHLCSSTLPSKIKTAIFGWAPRVASCGSPLRNCTMSPMDDSPSCPLLSLARGTACAPASAAELPTPHLPEPPTVSSGSPQPRASFIQPTSLKERARSVQLPPSPVGHSRMTPA